MAERHDTIIIGGGQAGLAMSCHVQQYRQPHAVLERGRVAERWRTERWDSLRYQFINRSIALPGAAYDGREPDGFAHHTEITRFIEDYAARIAAPLRLGVEVTRLSRNETDQYVLDTTAGRMTARFVIVATGPFQQPMIPAVAANLPGSVHQLHAARYRGPDMLPPGAVLVVGSGASGCQIADELLQAGRQVLLSVSRHRRVPRRHRGRDVLWWLERMGRFDITIDSFPERRYPPSTVITGVNGGYDMNVRRFAADGGTVLGRLIGGADGKLATAGDADTLLGEADHAFADFIAAADALAEKPEIADHLSDDNTSSPSPIPVAIGGAGTLDLAGAGIGTVIWATGYRFDYGWIDLPVFDVLGAPLQQRGVTACPGLYFLGLHWMHTFGSGLLSYVGRDAAYLAQHLDMTARR